MKSMLLPLRDIDIKLTRADPTERLITRLAGDPSLVGREPHSTWAWQSFLDHLETVVAVQHKIVS